MREIKARLAPYEAKYLPLHEVAAEGRHPEHGPFRVLRSLLDSSIIVECAGKREVLTLRALMDGYFEALGSGAEGGRP